jgi:hypothetical protein
MKFLEGDILSYDYDKYNCKNCYFNFISSQKLKAVFNQVQTDFNQLHVEQCSNWNVAKAALFKIPLLRQSQQSGNIVVLNQSVHMEENLINSTPDIIAVINESLNAA